MKNQLRWIALLSVGVVVVAAYVLWPRGYCRSARSKYGLKLQRCPDGDLRQTVRIRGEDLRRSGEGMVSLSVTGLYTIARSDAWQYAEIRDFDAELSLVDSEGQSTRLDITDGWKRQFGEKSAKVTLPRVTDGDYKLRAEISSKVGKNTVDLPLALYAPARIHLLTDRPLYEPGNEVAFRALVVRARDLSPIDRRPGTWIVRDPGGEVLLEERAPAGEWGVVSGSFPLDRDAPTGMWSVSWNSGNDQKTVQFKVEPFTLPRFRIEAAPGAPYYRIGDTPTLSGSVVYSSGAPVVGARVNIEWRSSGAWPPPTAWMNGGLPRQLLTDENGSFETELPEVPDDLLGQATLIALMSAVDPANDRVEGSSQILLSKDAINVQAITGLGNGLVENANNRTYLRVTTADGRGLPGARIQVKPSWAPDDTGIEATLDSDSVARVQLDPGPPINVVIPAMPVRAQAVSPGQLVVRTQADEIVGEDGASAEDLLQMDRWLAPLEACAKWVVGGSNSVRLGVRVSEAGAVVAGVGGDSPLDRCVLAVAKRLRLPRGQARVYALGFLFQEAHLPTLDIEVNAPVDNAPEGLYELFETAALDARDCLPRGVDSDIPWVLSWTIARGQKTPQVSWLRLTGDVPMPAGAAECVRSRIVRRSLAQPADVASLGVAHMSLSSGVEPEEQHIGPQATIRKGYELGVAVIVDDRPFGDTRLVVDPGQVPELRVRANPVLARPGEDVEFELIRGPGYSGDLPEKLEIRHFGDSQEIDLDDDTRTATYKLPDDARGWYEGVVAGKRALVYVRPQNQLSVGVTPAQPRYQPGSTARLDIQTRIGARGARAAVGLFGVDDSLGQLAALPGPDELGELRSKVTMNGLAFGTLDASALSLGRITGQFASEATILRVGGIPLPPDIDIVVSGSAETEFDPIAELTDRFYIILAELHAQTRAWEKDAPPDEQMKPATMARLWKRALDAVKARGGNIEDAFGRRLRLHRLPYDLFTLTDPRQVVVVGTRLPEDVENWHDWVAENKP